MTQHNHAPELVEKVSKAINKRWNDLKACGSDDLAIAALDAIRPDVKVAAEALHNIRAFFIDIGHVTGNPLPANLAMIDEALAALGHPTRQTEGEGK